MNKRVFKYPFDVQDDVSITMPKGARILTVAAQYDRPCVWAEVNPDASPETRQFRLSGTGHALGNDEGLPYVGTFQLYGGMLVFHLFERPR